jgi:hypothetical protein
MLETKENVLITLLQSFVLQKSNYGHKDPRSAAKTFIIKLLHSSNVQWSFIVTSYELLYSIYKA